MKIHSKRGMWYVTAPPDPVKTFDSEEAAIAYVRGEQFAEPDDDDDYEWELGEE